MALMDRATDSALAAPTEAPAAGADRPWKVAPRDAARAGALARDLGVSAVTAHLLLRLGHEDREQARTFLEPSLAGLLDPAGLPGIAAACDRLERALAAREPVLLFGDYDVDGITGSAVLHEVLRALGFVVEAHIPDRAEGYGLSRPRLERAAAEGVKVVISIDNGIAALDEAAFLKGAGIDLIVCDHHGFAERLPEACALIHPRLPGSTYANPHLCGAGVAFKLAWAIAARRGRNGRAEPAVREVLLRCLALVALGTVADVVPLVGENRVLVRYGLRTLGALAGKAEQAGPGLAALCALARLEGRAPDTTDVGFRLAPRLNAAGRMGRARRAFELLVTRDPAEARRLAEELDAENRRRREVQQRVYEEACAQVDEVYGERPQAAGLVAWSEGWPHGIVGIVAAKLTERYGRPALVASLEPGRAKGSGRTAGGVDLLAALESARPLFERLGGHAAALGFTAAPERLEEIRAAFDRGVRDGLGLGPDADPREVAARLDGFEVVADAEIGLEEVSRELLDELEALSPFGEGNPEPVFAAREVVLAGEPRLLGDSGKHVAFMLKQGGRVVRTVAFGRPDLWALLRERASGPGGPRPFQVAFRPRLNRWKGEARVELELEAIKFEG